MPTLKARVRRLLESDPREPLSKWVDRVLVTLIVLNVLAIVVETVGDVATAYREPLLAFEWASVAVFGAEYLLRLWSATEDRRYASPVLGRLRWMATPSAIIDLLAIAPALVTMGDLRFLRVLRLLRLLKLTRYSESLRILVAVFRSRRAELTTSFVVVLIALVLASSFIYYAERDAQPDKFSSIPAAMWWGIVTLTTVGYGDVVPITPAGRLVGGFAVVAGVLALALPVGLLASAFTQEIESRHRKPAACPHCGHELAPPKT